jgi:hypothetical protein
VRGVRDLLKLSRLGPVYGVGYLSIHLYSRRFKWPHWVVVTSRRVIYAIYETSALTCFCIVYRRVCKVVVTHLSLAWQISL